jgi:hypothetical protein
MKSRFLQQNPSDLLVLGGLGVLSVVFFAFFGKDLALASAVCVAVNFLLILGLAAAGV